jgi:selenoprotein W-related protein
VLNTFKQKVAQFTLIPAGGGCFEFSVNGELVYSKLETDEFPDENWVLKQVESRLKKR